MDAFVIIIGIIFGVFAILLLISRLLPSLGEIGEKKVSKKLRKKLPIEEYVVIDDVTIPSQYGTAQIDHIVVSVYGIFIIETKNYSGIISGSDNSEYWIKNVFGNKYEFRNPLKQNFGHVKALQAFIDLPRSFFFPIVCFTESSKLNITTRDPVVHTKDLINVIRSQNNRKLDVDEMQKWVNVIQKSAIKDKNIKKIHVKNVKANVAERESKIKNHICPRCGGLLILRHGQFGSFWGCSNYPNCKFTLNAKDR